MQTPPTASCRMYTRRHDTRICSISATDSTKSDFTESDFTESPNALATSLGYRLDEACCRAVAFVLTIAFWLLPQPALAQSDHCGSISADELWVSSIEHTVSCDITIEEGATLTIQPGSTIRFEQHAQINVKGTLLAAGTSGSLITFTSYRDLDVNVTDDDDAALGDWGNIQFKSGSSGVISRAVIQYSGRDSGFGTGGLINDAPIVVTNSSPTLSHISFYENLHAGAEIDAGGDWNTVGDSDRWTSDTVVYVIDKSSLVIPAEQALFIDPGVKIKLGKARTVEVYGFLEVAGTSNSPAVFTSLKDDTVCGIGARDEPVCDTNVDGEGSAPAIGDWGNIQFAQASNSTSQITRAVVRYSGSVSGTQVRDGAIQLENASPFLDVITFEQNHVNGATLRTGIDWLNDTWDSSTVVYVLDRLDLTIPANQSLAIKPNAKIKLGKNVSLDINGKLVADGSAASQIVFTSLSDDTVCGMGAQNEPICDTNGDGESTSPAVGDWGNIQFRPGSDDSSSISNALFKYSGSESGNNIDDGPIWLENASPQLAHISFESNYINGVELAGGLSWQSDVWDNSTIVYVIEDGDITIALGETLTISPGLTLKLDDDNSILVDGKILATGTESAPIRFTSLHDDSGCGTGANGEAVCDTYNDGQAQEPQVGDWGYIRFGPDSDDTSIISRADIRYSGSNLGLDINDGAIYLDNASPTLSYISFLDNYINGAELRGRADWTTTSWANQTVIYVLEEGDITIPVSETLTVAAGTILKIGNHSSINVHGNVQAIGSSNQPITVTSLYDDQECGQGANNEEICTHQPLGRLTDPSPGDWGKINFFPTSGGSTISRAAIRYGGTGNDRNDNATILLNNVAPSLSYISFRNNEINGVNLGTDEEYRWDSSQWDNNTIVYVVQDGDILIPQAQEIVAAQGTKFKLDANSSLLVDGQLTVAGTQSAPVYLTSFKDDTVCGTGAFDEEICDTNGDASLNSSQESGTTTIAADAPQKGDWGHIRFSATSTSASTIERAIIRYSGNDSGIELNDSAILLEDGASPAILYSVLTQNYRGLETTGGASPALTCNDIYGNQDVGIYNGTDLTDQTSNSIDNEVVDGVVVARNHWWGDVSGPSHASNSGGAGESISDNVAYTPWEERACMQQEKPDRTAPTLEADLVISVPVAPALASPGGILRYVIKGSNIGPENATGTVITLSLPGQVTITSATFPGGSCVKADDGVSCIVGNLATGRQVEIELIASVDATLSSDLTLTTSISSAEIDPNATNNSVVTLVKAADGMDEMYLPVVMP